MSLVSAAGAEVETLASAGTAGALLRSKSAVTPAGTTTTFCSY